MKERTNRVLDALDAAIAANGSGNPCKCDSGSPCAHCVIQEGLIRAIEEINRLNGIIQIDDNVNSLPENERMLASQVLRLQVEERRKIMADAASQIPTMFTS